MPWQLGLASPISCIDFFAWPAVIFFGFHHSMAVWPSQSRREHHDGRRPATVSWARFADSDALVTHGNRGSKYLGMRHPFNSRYSTTVARSSNAQHIRHNRVLSLLQKARSRPGPHQRCT